MIRHIMTASVHLEQEGLEWECDCDGGGGGLRVQISIGGKPLAGGVEQSRAEQSGVAESGVEQSRVQGPSESAMRFERSP